MSDIKDLVDFREYNPVSDRNFVTSSWLKSYRNIIGRSIPSSIYFTEQQKIIDDILEDSNIIVACNKQDSNQIFGYLVYQGPASVDYVYVKHCYRKFGLAKMMLSNAGIDTESSIIVSHMGYRRKNSTLDLIYIPRNIVSNIERENYEG